MAKSATPSGLFVRQASGLVRDVSMANALFFNIAAFVGTSVGWAIAFYALYPEWQALGISAYAYIAVLTGIACYFLGMIFASLTTAMPRSGGDYVFTSRIISPFWGWIESWTLVGSALTIIGFEIIVASHNLQLIGILIGVAFPGSVFGNAQNWLQDNTSKIIVGIIILLVIAGISILKTRTFHKVVMGLTIFAIISVAINFIGAFTVDQNSTVNALPALGTSSKAIMDAATKAGFSLGSPDFSILGLVALAGLASVVLFQYIGFQFSSYIAGEVKGNVRRAVFIAVIGALLCAVYAIFLSRIVLAWALDRQVPEWFSVVNERTNAPLRVIVIAVLLGAVFYVLTFFGVSLASTTFFGILLAGLTWIMPGLNAILIPYRRPDLFQLTNNTGKFLGLPRLVWYGILWLIFIVPVYAAAFVWPVIKGLLASGSAYLALSNSSGVGWALVFIAVAIVIYFVMRFVNTSRGINVKMIFQELPPD